MAWPRQLDLSRLSAATANARIAPLTACRPSDGKRRGEGIKRREGLAAFARRTLRDGRGMDAYDGSVAPTMPARGMAASSAASAWAFDLPLVSTTVLALA